MSHLGFKSVVYRGDARLGELEAIPVKDSNFQFPNNEIRISYLSPPSERCPPLSVLQTLSSVRCKLESNLVPERQPQLLALHACCFHELQTAVVQIGNEEIHLVAMPSKQKKFPCFWCYVVPRDLYESCLRMLNLRCLSIVFDLDETLIVANTLKSFEDRIDAMRSWLAHEVDGSRALGMANELKRLSDDRALLKQYAECDSVSDNGKVYKIQLEEVSPLSGTHENIVRPIIRLPEKNIVLTRIKPEIRDTSVLVRLRPAWEDLRSYLTAKGRKRFEVYVCTMAERDYALEMWRLLDPEANLINSKELSRRVICVKSGSRKSLLNVFQGGICHPKMAMVIDDRSNVWEDKDQPRVHVVPAFSPYYAPQAETANAVPILCVARNVACNVRAGFFREFDENLLKRISELSYEDEVASLPSPPEVSNYLMWEDFSPGLNGNNIPVAEGMRGAEVEQRLHQDEKRALDSASQSSLNAPETRADASQLPTISAPDIAGPAHPRPNISAQNKPSLPGVSAGRDGLSSEPSNEMRRSFLAMRPGQDIQNPVSGDPHFLKLPGQTAATHPQAGWLVEDDSCRVDLSSRVSTSLTEPDAMKTEKQRSYQLSEKPRGRIDELGSLHERQKQNLPSNQLPGGGISEVVTSQNLSFAQPEEFSNDVMKANTVPSSLYISVLQEIGRRCSSKVEFRPVMSTSKDLQFSVEVLFTGEKIGVGMGKTRKDAQQQAAESALRCLADKYVSCAALHLGSADKDSDVPFNQNDNGFIWEDVDTELSELSTDEKLHREGSSEAAEGVPGGNSRKLVNQQAPKRASSPRMQSIPSKRWKEEDLRVSDNLSSGRQMKNGHQVL